MASAKNKTKTNSKATTKQQTDQQKIGALIKELRQDRNMTQSEFAKSLKTSQSAVARMERGGQNFTTNELAKISDVLHRKIISVEDPDSVDFEINGGKKLSGAISTNTSKNGALFLIFSALLNKGTTILRDVPKIEEINRVMELFDHIGVSIRWIDHDNLEIQVPKKIDVKNLMHESAGRIRSSLMAIGPLLATESKFTIPHAGGCKMGKRTIAAHKFGLEKLGVKIDVTDDGYEVSRPAKMKSTDVVMYEMGDTATINVVLAAASIEGETIIKFASSNYQVQDACRFLQRLGVQIDGVGTATLKVRGKKDINENIEHYVCEDPTETMMLLTAGIITKSEITIKRCPIDFLELELLKLEKMGLKYSRGAVYKAKDGFMNLVDIKIKPSKMRALDDKIAAQPYPGINTDNLPFFVTIAALAEGKTLIHDWMWESRAIYFTELNNLGAQIDLYDAHRVSVRGVDKLKPAQIVCPPALRPSTVILIAMLAAPGKSILRNVYSIKRGYEEIADRLNSIGADIKVVKGV
jgi:UDP-N-acetylglucosamine 1-carboxyvinyltransferase